MTLKFSPADNSALPLHILEPDQLAGWLNIQPEPVCHWVGASGFTARTGEAMPIPGPSGMPIAAIAGIGSARDRARQRFALAAAAAKLPEAAYRIESGPKDEALEVEALGWLLAQYGFHRYREQSGIRARLQAPEDIDAVRVETIAAGEALTRDLINTPASDMGPAELEATVAELAERHGAKCAVIRRKALRRDFPLIHAVGRASARAPRLLDMRWGTGGPMLTLAGKGVCFDTGGLNLKPATSMELMKKDMGGAATVLGLAHAIMSLQLPLRLRVLIPAVENSVSGNAFRPGDILAGRNGLTVEINNTDAEGRLVLADTLALAAEENPDVLISMATLTGAARVALGPDIAPYYVGDARIASALDRAAKRVADPIWRMPFHEPYEAMIEPGIADLDNAPRGGFAGSITAALFLRRFAGDCPGFVHFDIYGWQPKAAPARPKGGTGQGARAILDALPEILAI